MRDVDVALALCSAVLCRGVAARLSALRRHGALLLFGAAARRLSRDASAGRPCFAAKVDRYVDSDSFAFLDFVSENLSENLL